MKTDFYSRAPAQGYHEDLATSSGVVDLSGGRDTALDVEADEGEIEAEKTSDSKAPTKAIDSEEILGDATNEIDVGVEVVVPSKMESGDIGVASPCKTSPCEGSPNSWHFGIGESEKSAEGGPSAKEEKTAEEPKDAVDMCCPFFIYNFNLLARLNCINILCRIRLSVIVPRGRWIDGSGLYRTTMNFFQIAFRLCVPIMFF